ncbi:MAG TPA: hypothetical protein VFJ77_00215 [Gaiellaceae bacterium]|nr:hypothetical protein [Gaiellaceae bacterium]
MSVPGAGARVGRPAPFRLVAAYLVAALVAFLLAAVALLRAAPDLAHGWIATPDTLLAVHLLALGFLPLAVTGAALHVLPTLLRNSAHAGRGWVAFAGLCAGPFLAVGVARHQPELTWATAAAVGIGGLVVAAEVGVLVARAPHGRLLLASRAGVGLSALHALLAFLLGPLLFERMWRPWLGIPHDRLIAIHLHLAVLGWLTLLIVAVGRTLAPMLALAPSEPARSRPLEELLLAAGVWVAVAGLAAGRGWLVAAGDALCVVALARFVGIVVRAARRRRVDAVEGPLAHFLAGLVFLAEAAVLSAVLLSGSGSPQLDVAYVALLLLGWAGGVTLGHAGKLLSLSAWTWWPPGPRPKQGELYHRGLWTASAAAFAVGTQLLAAGALATSTGAVRAGGAALVLAAAVALGGAVQTLRRAGVAPAGRPL